MSVYGGMLDILNLRKSGYFCGLCSCSIKGENCTPKSCSHTFHINCLEEWASGIDSSSEFACPVSGCSSSFTEILIRKAPGAVNFTTTSLKEDHQCPICCEKIQKPVATPESCNHAFCYVCLKEWSRVRHECPLDRGSYELILLSDRVGGPITKRVNAPPVKQQPPETPPLELDTNCEVCQRPDDEAHLLLCDHCDRGYHTYCLPTPLSSIPDGDWFCPDCVRHRVVPPDSTSNNAADTQIRRTTRRRLIDSEAEESDNDELNTTLEESSSENLNLRHELSHTAQRRLEEQATRRHRGRRLLQDLIADLSQRVTSEASVRARRRQSQRQRVRNQLASESTNINGSGVPRISQTTICFEIPSSTNQPVSLRLGRPPSGTSSSGRSRNHSTTRSERNGPVSSANQQELSRKRLRILSSSDSESDDESGIALRCVKLTGHRPRVIRSPSHESNVEEFPPASATSSLVSPTGNDESDSSVLNGSSSHEDSTTSESSYTYGIQNSTTENIQGESDSELSEFNANYNPPVKTTQKIRKILKKKPKRRLSNKKTIKRRVKRRVVKSKTTRRTRKRRICRKIPRLSTSISSNSPKASTSSQPRVRSGVIGTGLPKLSILGKETHCNFRLIVDEHNDEAPIRSPSPPCNPIATTSSVSVPQLNSRSSTYLSDIEAAQDSLFHFSTRHMQVNPDHSMSPIPVTKQSSSHNKTNTASIKTNPVSLNNSPPAQCSTDTISGIHKSPVFSNQCINAKGDSSTVQSVSVPTSSAAIPSTSHDYPNEANSSHPGWSPESVHRVKSTLKHNLKAYIASHCIDKETCRDIFQRAWGKIVQKPPRKVTDERIAKLVDDYVQYCLRHRT
uniref:PHD and RING finger domain-containing protein 1 n=1 Tax=Trichobilharzia regenti TaxID=157069 RepID=A0AA85JQQ2_TRIRE|nr:unnamed protein product [Trichobilharzia regenti]